MRTKLFAMALVSCLELVMVSGSAQAQLFGFGGRRWGVTIGEPVYYDGYYGYRNGYYEPGVSYSWGGPYYGERGYWAGNRYFFPRYEYTPAYTSPYFAFSNYAVTPTIVDPSVTVASISANDVNAQPTGAVTSQSFYSGPPANNDRMEFRVMLPAADAKLFFNGHLIEQQGDNRTLTTPSAMPGEYDYRVQATWMDNGQEKSEIHNVHLRPGQLATIHFGPTKERKQ